MSFIEEKDIELPRACGGNQLPPASAGAGLRGHAYMGILIAHHCILGLVPKHPDEHASPLGRAHIAPVNPGEVGCDRPERASASERAGFVT